MNRLVTDNPQTNTEVLFNLAYVKDKEVWIRGGGDDGEDCTLIDFTNRMCASHDCLFDITPNKIDEEDIENTGEHLLECSMSGCPIGTAYFIAIQAAELRERLKEQEAIEPIFKKGEDGIFVWACGSCGAYMYHIYDGIDKAKEYAKYCRLCGKKVKWYADD